MININKARTFDPVEKAKHSPATLDLQRSFFLRNATDHGYLYLNLAADKAAADAPIFDVTGKTEITLQAFQGTPAAQGSLDGITWVTANTTASADGLIRILSKYRLMRVAFTTVSVSDNHLYIMLT